MEPKELNTELKEELSKVFTALFKEIGSNRQQLANKVLSHHKEIYKELNKDEVNEVRKREILSDVARVVKMAAQQLPHLKVNAPKPATLLRPVAARVTSDSPPKPTAPAKVVPPKTAVSAPAKIAPKAKPLAVKAKVSTPSKKASPATKKKKK